jgi:C-terminal processing protease CtpA/Prc
VPRANIDEPFTLDRTGISLNQEDPAAFSVLSIVPGGPAAQAGLHPGDRIVAIAGRSIARENLGLLDLRRYTIGRQPFTLTTQAQDGSTTVATIHPRDLLPPLY